MYPYVVLIIMVVGVLVGVCYGAWRMTWYVLTHDTYVVCRGRAMVQCGTCYCVYDPTHAHVCTMHSGV